MNNPTTKIVKIGNSQGVRIPKILLEQANLGEEVELVVGENQLILRALIEPRTGWAEAFARMAAVGDDALLESDDLNHEWDDEEWEW
ncbi:MAG: AbrB/MazE/SpoVT family DNA-binding domain-containing protein [Anaerolineae bacterium]|nr:MAG: AbrB/MazE/SpoVT family DNA-binding domain-containing protein [Anaerolineae bacterium]